MKKNKLFTFTNILIVSISVLLWLSIEPIRIACYDEESLIYNFPVVCFDRTITMHTGRDHYLSIFKIPDSYFTDNRFNKDGFGLISFSYRKIMLRYLYPEMKPLKPILKKIRTELREEGLNFVEINEILSTKYFSLEIYGLRSPHTKKNIQERYLLVGGKILENNENFTKYGRSTVSYFDYHYWIKNKQYPYVIACTKKGRCAIYSSFNDMIAYRFSISEEMFMEWEHIDQLVRIEIKKFLQH